MIFLSQKFAQFVIFLYLCIVKQKQNVIYKLQSKKRRYNYEDFSSS